MRTVLTTLHSKFIHASLALPYLAAWCGDECGEIVIREFTDHEPKENVAALILAEAPDVVAFSVYIWNRSSSLELADLLQTIRPELRIVLGGPEVSFDGAELFAAHPGLSALVHGEGEIPLHGLLKAWAEERQPDGVPRLSWRKAGQVITGPDAPPMTDLDRIPSPFRLGLADLSRGFSYYETSRGCPYNCSFCMSSLDNSVRSFSLERIKDDLSFLIGQEVPKIKLVDRTFNYDAGRAREIFAFILEKNRQSHFHFEIGAHLLDEETLTLLEKVPAGMFQFEIGIQSTLPETLSAIDRKVSTVKLLQNIEALIRRTDIHIHLDLIAGLPGESYIDFLTSFDRVMQLQPEHLQIEPVKLLPGAPLRRDAAENGIHFDPNPPYTIVRGDGMNYQQLESIRAISRLLDLSWNNGRLHDFLSGLGKHHGSFARGIEQLALFLRQRGIFRHPIGLTPLFEAIFAYVLILKQNRDYLQELLACDYARCERVLPDRAPDFFDVALSPEERDRVRQVLKDEQEKLRGEKVKLQFFAARFNALPPLGKHLRLFIYLTRSGQGRQVIERIIETPSSQS